MVKNPPAMEVAWIRSLVWEDPTFHRAIKPMCHNSWACALVPGSCNYWAHVHACSAVSDSATPWTEARQTPLFMDRQDMELVAISSSRISSWSRYQTWVSPALTGRFFTTTPPRKPNWAHELQLLKPAHSKACAPQQEKPPQWEAHTAIRE